MARNEQAGIEVALSALVEKVVGEDRLAAELQRAQRLFFGEGARPAVDGVAMRRFYEWFLLERESEGLGAVPVDLPQFATAGEVLSGSLVGVFHVTAADPGSAIATDLQDGETVELSVPEGTLLAGDLLVGRLFPVGIEQWLPSPAAAVFRPGTAIAASFQRDLQKLGLERRLQQLELEQLMHRRPEAAPITRPTDAVPLEHLEADLDRLLGPAGGRHSATAISAQLAAAPRLGAAISPLLDELAFATQVDLDAVRRVLLQMWQAHHPPSAETGPAGAPTEASAVPPGTTLGERLVRTLDEGLGRHDDVEGLFAELERLAGLEPGAADDEENPFDREDVEAPGDGLSGDLEPLVEEFVWETTPSVGDAAMLRLWIGLQKNAPNPHADLEQVQGTDLMRLLLHVYLGAEPTGRAEAVRAAFAVLQRFYRWVAEAQQLELGAALGECRGALLDHLDRLATASMHLSTPVSPSQRPGMLEVEAIGADGCGVKDDHGRGHWLQLPANTLHLLRVGDLVLGALGGTGRAAVLSGLVVVLPQDARTLME